MIRKKINESYSEISSEAKSTANAVFKDIKDDVYEDAKEKFPDIKKSDLSVDIYEANENRIEFGINVGNEDGWYDVTVNIDKWNKFIEGGKKSYDNGIWWSFND